MRIKPKQINFKKNWVFDGVIPNKDEIHQLKVVVSIVINISLSKKLFVRSCREKERMADTTLCLSVGVLMAVWVWVGQDRQTD